MSIVVYTTDDAINGFFANTGAASSRSEYDEFARQRHPGEVQPVDIQGVTSYTVIAGPSGGRILQFREQHALLDMKTMTLAKEVHGDFVPSCSELGWVGDLKGSRLMVYEMDKLPGETYIIAQSSPTAREARLNTVQSLSKFKYLADTLPERFLPSVADAQAALPVLLDGRYPVVLTHSDLNGTNILVSPSSGEITGVVDWPGNSALPFGFSLYALENVLGSMNYDGWTWHDDAVEMRQVIWDSLVEEAGLLAAQCHLAKQTAKAGVLVRYSTPDNCFAGMIGTGDPSGDGDFRYLDALVL
ncbi:hypothetical protein RB595_000599 [Gaeumannomyces hyphopodioides]